MMSLSHIISNKKMGAGFVRSKNLKNGDGILRIYPQTKAK